MEVSSKDLQEDDKDSCWSLEVAVVVVVGVVVVLVVSLEVDDDDDDDMASTCRGNATPLNTGTLRNNVKPCRNPNVRLQVSGPYLGHPGHLCSRSIIQVSYLAISVSIARWSRLARRISSLR